MIPRSVDLMSQSPAVLFGEPGPVIFSIMAAGVWAHDAPANVTVHMQLRAEGGAMRALVRIPLEAVRDISRAGELMPQKSTFFFPKLATGLFLSPLS